MKGILFVSHGKMAEGMIDSLIMFFGERPENIDYLGLSYEDGPEKFKEILEEKIDNLNQGDGVIIFSDLFGGTPANTASLFINTEVEVVAGMNLAMALECLGSRGTAEKINIAEIIQVGKEGIVYINDVLREKAKN